MELYHNKDFSTSIHLVDKSSYNQITDSEDEDRNTMDKVIITSIVGTEIQGKIYLPNYITSIRGDFTRLEYYERSDNTIIREVIIKIKEHHSCTPKTKDSPAFIEFSGEVVKCLKQDTLTME